MRYFNQEFFEFFSTLERNNTKDWFDRNRKIYEQNVKIPFRNFVGHLLEALQDIYPEVDLSNTYSIGRINRDIRFGSDKTPYKTHMSVMIMPHGKGDRTKPGFYLEMSHKGSRIYSGAHMLEKNQLEAIRHHIMDNIEEFKNLIEAPSFQETFGEIQGDKHKRLPIEFQEAAILEPLIANKNFYWFFKLKTNELLEEGLIDNLVRKYKTALPLNQFFEEVLLQNPERNN